MSAIDKLRTSNQTDITLDRGTTVTIKRVADVFDAILAGGDIPLPVLNELEADKGTTPERTVSERIEFLRDSRHRQDWAIRSSVVAIDGEPVTIPEDVPIAELFSTDERRLISDYALWADAEGEG